MPEHTKSPMLRYAEEVVHGKVPDGTPLREINALRPAFESVVVPSQFVITFTFEGDTEALVRQHEVELKARIGRLLLNFIAEKRLGGLPSPDTPSSLLLEVLGIIEQTDPDREDDDLEARPHLSGADTVQALCELEPRIRKVVE